MRISFNCTELYKPAPSMHNDNTSVFGNILELKTSWPPFINISRLELSLQISIFSKDSRLKRRISSDSDTQLFLANRPVLFSELYSKRHSSLWIFICLVFWQSFKSTDRWKHLLMFEKIIFSPSMFPWILWPSSS